MNNATPAIHPSPEFQLSEFLRMAGASLRQLHNHPALSWVTPQLPVRLLQADGNESLWLSGRRAGDEARLRSARFTAIEVPAELALTRSLALPPLSGSDLRDAVALDVRDANPFDPSDLVWGYRTLPGAAGQVDVLVALASRRLVLQHIEQAAGTMTDGATLEAWVLADEGPPVVLRGFGEAARARSATRGRVLAWALIVVSLMLLTAIAVTPTVQLHLRTLQATGAYQSLQQRAGPAMAQREALVRGREDLTNLQEVMSDHIEPLVAIDMLTRLIPDDTFLQRVQAQGTRFTVTGQTPNAAALMNTLSSNPGLRDVRAPSPATRSGGTNRETFVVEFTIAPDLLRPAKVAAAVVPPGIVAPGIVAPAIALPPVVPQPALAPPAVALPVTPVTPPLTPVTPPVTPVTPPVTPVTPPVKSRFAR